MTAKVMRDAMFQSSPVPKDGCNKVQQRARLDEVSEFQSSPVPKDGCNSGEEGRPADVLVVSILTRPEGRVQPATEAALLQTQIKFQSSPVPKDGCNRQVAQGITQPKRFNPHPSRRTGATCQCPILR